MLQETTYYIYQNCHIGSIRETKENYEHVMKSCIERKYAHTHEERVSELIGSETHDTFYDEDGNVICCLSKFEEKGETK